MIIKTQRTIFISIILLSLTTLISCKMFKSTTSKYPTGTQTRELLNDTNACPWYAGGYEEYTPNTEAVTKLEKGFTTEHKLLIFGGTWCGDTQNLLPKFYKVVDAMKQSPEIQLVMVDLNKVSGEGIETKYKISYVPTFIVLKNGKEIGRIVEVVNESIEADLAAILNR